ncbi:MAG: ABC transporter ATP-binding protein/permease [Bacilli bacterium]|nr:ABC transporter ATP-binding protein/permease [Bacilli bacterium]
MIEIKNLIKKYNDVEILNNISLDFPRTGIVAILGPSGCGKTTLLNCIGGLIPFFGSIKINNQSIREEDADNFRLQNIGFVFQDFRLFNNETVIENILFPLETLSNEKQERKIIKCKELLKLVGLSNKGKQFVSTLSGGEKQRVCIARSLVNDPKIILADEPTGALDSKNGKQIMDILAKISTSSLVVFVTHDSKLAHEYGDEIIEMKDGQIENHTYNTHTIHESYLPILKSNNYAKKPAISPLFLVKHSLHALSRRKIRSFICTMTTSLSLIGVGLALSLSMIISNNIKEAYSSLVKKDQVIVSVKDTDSNVYGEYSASEYEVEEAFEKYSNFAIDTGFVYEADFENIFCDSNELCVDSSIYHSPIKGITARNINEFEWLDISENIFYPKKPENLLDDEIVLGLNMTTISDICYLLHIERSIDSFSQYLLGHDCTLVFNFEHLDWSYSDQQIVNLKAFTLDSNLKIYHTNHKWNEYMFETQMRFPTIDSSLEESYYPWTLKKIPYIYCNEKVDSFLTSIKEDKSFNSIVFDIGSNKYFPLLYKNVNIKDRHRILAFSNNIKNIPLNLVNYFEKFEPMLFNPILGSYKGYVIYPTSLMMGFSDKAFVSFDKESVNDAVDIETSLMLEATDKLDYPNDMVVGHFTKTMQNGLNFNVVPEYVDKGETPNGLDEIVISESLFKLSKVKELGEIMYFGFPFSQTIGSDGKTIQEYTIVPLKVVGIVNSNENCLYHSYDWPTSFFQSRVGISAFNLQVQSISFSLRDSKQMKSVIKNLSTAFPEYNIINPLNDVNESVDELCNYVTIISTIFSLFASITSILLLSICTYLHVFESRKEIGLARCIGVTPKEANKFIYAHSITLTAIGFVVSSVELMLASLIISNEINGSFSFQLSPLSFIAMFGLSLIISLLSAKIISKTIAKNNPIEIGKY